MSSTTALHAKHLEAGAKMVDFFGWDMPINYGSQIEEHHAVRQDAGMFDVSHMTIVDVKGAQAKAYLQYLLANDVAKLKGNKQSDRQRRESKINAQPPFLFKVQGGVVEKMFWRFVC